MKKYDFYLLVLYIIPVIVFLIVCYGFYRHDLNAKRQAIAYFEKIYQVPVKTVVFENTNAICSVQGLGPNSAITNGVEFSGSLDTRFQDNFSISGDTLRIGDGVTNFVSTPGHNTIYNLNLYVSDDIKVDTINAPNIVIERPEILRDTVQHGI